MLRQATFHTDPINERKQGANLQLPVIEGDKEIKTVQSQGQDIKPQGKLVNETNSKNRTHIIETKADIGASLKAISDKAKAKQKEQKHQIEIEKKESDSSSHKQTVSAGNKETKVPLKDKNTNIGVNVKAISEKAKAQQKESSEPGKKSSDTKTPAKTSVNEAIKKDAVLISEHKNTVDKTQPKEQNIHAKTSKKPEDKTKSTHNQDSRKGKVDILQKEQNHTTAARAKIVNLSPVNKEKEETVKAGKGSKIPNNTNSEKPKTDISPQKDAVNASVGKDKKLVTDPKENINRHNETVHENTRVLTDKSKAKAGISASKDTHAATGSTVANGASPKPSENSNSKATVSKLTVGSAPRVTTLDAGRQNKTLKEQKDSTISKSKPVLQTVQPTVLVNPHELEIETVKKLIEPKAQIPNDKLVANTVKHTSDKTIQEPNLTNEPVKMDNTGSLRTDTRRGETYETVLAERNTLLKAEMAYKRRIKQLEDEANDFLKNIEELASENTKLHARLEAIELDLKTNKHSNADERTTKLERDKAELENKIQELEKSSSVSDDAKEANKQINDLKAQIIKLQTENQNVNEELIKEKAEHMNDLKRLRAIEKESKSLASSVTAVESEKLDTIQDLQKDHSKMKDENEAQKNKIAELEKKLNTLEFENKALSESLTQKKTELNELLGVMKDENKFDNELKDLKNQILKLEKEKKDTELQHNIAKRKLEDELNETKSKYKTSVSELDEHKVKVDELASEKNKLEQDNKRLTSTCDSQKKELDELRKEIQRLKNELLAIQGKLDSLKQDTESAATNLKDAKERLESTNKELQSIVSDKEGQISKLTAQLDTLRSEKDAEKNDFEHEKEKLTGEIDRLKIFEKHMNKMEMELRHFVEKYEESESRKNQLSVELEEKDYQISSLNEQIFEFNMKVDTMTKRIGQLDREKREVENEKREWEVKRDKFNDIEASNKRLMEENRRLRASLEDRSILDSNFSAEKTPKAREAWVSDPLPVDSLQKAIYVENKHGKKRVQIANQPALPKRRVPFTKSSPVKASKPPVLKKDLRTSLSPSRSLEDVRKSPISPVESNPSLPELQREGRLTYGFSYTQGYSQIHRNRIKAAQKKRVY